MHGLCRWPVTLLADSELTTTITHHKFGTSTSSTTRLHDHVDTREPFHITIRESDHVANTESD